MNRRFTASASGLELGRSAYPSYHFVTGNIPVKSEGLHNPETPYQLVSGNLPVRSAQDFPEYAALQKPPLAPNWMLMIAPGTGRRFYWNSVFSSMRWELPKDGDSGIEGKDKGEVDLREGNKSLTHTASGRSLSGRSTPHAEWQEVIEPTSGRVYYVNSITQETSWVKPADSAAGGGGSGDKAASADGGVNDWQEHLDASSNRPYFFSPSRNATVWERPPEMNGGGGGGGGGSEAADDGAAYDWEEHFDAAAQRPYYFSRSRNSTVWEKPKPPAGAPQAAASAGGGGQLDPAWTEYFDPGSGAAYYVHSTTQETTWTKPILSPAAAATTSTVSASAVKPVATASPATGGTGTTGGASSRGGGAGPSVRQPSTLSTPSPAPAGTAKPATPSAKPTPVSNPSAKTPITTTTSTTTTAAATSTTGASKSSASDTPDSKVAAAAAATGGGTGSAPESSDKRGGGGDDTKKTDVKKRRATFKARPKKEGYVLKRGGGSSFMGSTKLQRRYCVIAYGQVKYFKTEADSQKEGALPLKRFYIRTEHYDLDPMDDSDTDFVLRANAQHATAVPPEGMRLAPGDREFFFRVLDASEKGEWLAAIGRDD